MSTPEAQMAHWTQEQQDASEAALKEKTKATDALAARINKAIGSDPQVQARMRELEFLIPVLDKQVRFFDMDSNNPAARELQAKVDAYKAEYKKLAQ